MCTCSTLLRVLLPSSPSLRTARQSAAAIVHHLSTHSRGEAPWLGAQTTLWGAERFTQFFYVKRARPISLPHLFIPPSACKEALLGSGALPVLVQLLLDLPSLCNLALVQVGGGGGGR